MAGVTGLEPATSCVTGRRSNQTELHPHKYFVIPSRGKWWAMTGSNCRHSRCKRDALPAELIARKSCNISILVEFHSKKNPIVLIRSGF